MGKEGGLHPRAPIALVGAAGAAAHHPSCPPRRHPHSSFLLLLLLLSLPSPRGPGLGLHRHRHHLVPLSVCACVPPPPRKPAELHGAGRRHGPNPLQLHAGHPDGRLGQRHPPGDTPGGSGTKPWGGGGSSVPSRKARAASIPPRTPTPRNGGDAEQGAPPITKLAPNSSPPPRHDTKGRGCAAPRFGECVWGGSVLLAVSPLPPLIKTPPGVCPHWGREVGVGGVSCAWGNF